MYHRRVWPAILLTAVVFFALGTLFGAKVLYVRTDDNSTSIHVDKERLKAGAEKAAEKTGQAGEKLVEEARDAAKNVEVDVRRRDAARPTTERTD